MSSVTLHVLCQTNLKLGTVLSTGPAEKWPISSPVRLLIRKLIWASDKGFKIASCVASQTGHVHLNHGIQIWELSHGIPFQSFADSSTVTSKHPIYVLRRGFLLRFTHRFFLEGYLLTVTHYASHDQSIWPDFLWAYSGSKIMATLVRTPWAAADAQNQTYLSWARKKWILIIPTKSVRNEFWIILWSIGANAG